MSQRYAGALESDPGGRDRRQAFKALMLGLPAESEIAAAIGQRRRYRTQVPQRATAFARDLGQALLRQP